MQSVTRDEIADILNITPRMVNIHVKDDGMPQVARGKFNVAKVVHWYIRRLKDEIEAVKRGDETRQMSEGRILRATAEMKEDKLRQQRKELIPVAQILPVLERIVGAFKSARLAMGTVLAPQLEGKTRDEIKTIIESESRAQLTELANATIKLVDLYRLGDVHARADADAPAAATSHAKRMGRRAKSHKSRKQSVRPRPVEN